MKRFAEQLLRFTRRHGPGCAAAVILLGLLSGAALLRARFTNDVSRLFPDTPESRATFQVLRETRLADTVQLEFLSERSIVRHEAWLDRTAGRIAAIPGVRNVLFRYRSGDLLSELEDLTGAIPRMFPPDILRTCDPDAAARSAVKQLAFPAPGGMRLLRSQPFGIERTLLLRLKNLDETTGFLTAPEHPCFVSRDGKRAMIIFESGIELGDADAVRRLFAAVREAAAPLPEGVKMRIVSGCSHTLGNEETLKRDATVAGSVSLLFFLAIFFAFYRRGGAPDWRALWIPAVPLYASLLALGLMTLFFREICLYVIGLGSCITGLAIDQGIHVYAACRGPEAEKRVAALVKPMTLSAATSILVFVFLALTGICAYRQLAFFAGTSLALSCFIALALLPHLLDRDRPAAELPLPGMRFRLPGAARLLLCAAVAAAAGFGIRALLRNADFSLASLDGTPAEILREEAEFRAAWRKAGPSAAVIAAAGPTGDAAQQRLRSVTDRLEGRIAVAGPPVPPRSERRRNRGMWRSDPARREIAELETRTRAACLRAGLPANFFDPFFLRLRAGIDGGGDGLPPLLEHVSRRMVREHPGGASAVALMADSPENARAAREALRRQGFRDCALLSKEAFHTIIREELGGRFRVLFALSVLAALLLAAAVFRNFTDVLRALTPVLVSFALLAVLGGATGFRATPAAAFALVLLTGLAVDYGIYAVCRRNDPDMPEVRTPVVLSAVTTVAGAGALLVSKHPALFGTGAVLAPGIAAACLCGLALASRPAGAAPKGSGEKKKPHSFPTAALPLLFVLLFSGGGCAGKGAVSPREAAAAEEIRERLRLYPDTPFTVQGVARLEAPGRGFTFLLGAEIDPAAGKIRAAAVHPGSGVLLFRIPEAEAGSPAAASPPPRELLRTARNLSDALRRIFLHKNPEPLAVSQKQEYIAVCSADGVETRLHPWGMERRRDAWFSPSWRCEYRDGGKETVYRIPERGVSLRLSIRHTGSGEKNDPDTGLRHRR